MDIGIDIEEIARFKLPKKSPFIKKTFFDSEISYCYNKSSPETHLCGIFCAKEAVRKSLGGKKIPFLKIEIKHEKNAPYVRIKGRKTKIEGEFKISISHSKEYAVAVAINLQKGFKW